MQSDKIKSLAGARLSSVSRYFLGSPSAFHEALLLISSLHVPPSKRLFPCHLLTQLPILLLPHRVLAGGCQELYVSSPDLFHKLYLLEGLKWQQSKGKKGKGSRKRLCPSSATRGAYLITKNMSHEHYIGILILK